MRCESLECRATLFQTKKVTVLEIFVLTILTELGLHLVMSNTDNLLQLCVGYLLSFSSLDSNSSVSHDETQP